MKQHILAQKRHAKKLKRKNKKYTGPKYSQLEQMLAVAPLLERAGIKLFEQQFDWEGYHNDQKDNKGSTTSFV